MNRKIWTGLFVFACMLLYLAGSFRMKEAKAAKANVNEDALGKQTQEMIDQWFQSDFQGYLDQYQDQLAAEEGGEEAVKEFQGYAKLQDQVGAYKETTAISYSYEKDKDGNDIIIATAEVLCEKNKMTVNATFNAKGTMIEIRFAKYKAPKAEPKSAMIKRAGLNTVMSMAIVFAVLIVIAFVISGFVLISAAQSSSARSSSGPIAAAPAPGAAVESPAAGSVAEDVTDDLELVAVITAAVAAVMESEGRDSSGFVVRSIVRKKS